MRMKATSRLWPRADRAVLGLLAAASLVSTALADPVTGQGIAAPPPALGMAVPLPDPGMANAAPGGIAPANEAPRPPTEPPPTPVIATPGPKRPRGFGGLFPDEGGRLPNQRTGHRHEHVVRDICIGC